MKAIRSKYTKQPDEKLTANEVRVLVRGLMEESVSKLIVIARWALGLSVVAIVLAVVALGVVVMR